MPKVLIVAATFSEIEPICKNYSIEVNESEGLFSNGIHPNVNILLTGVGMVNTAYFMGKYPIDKFDYIINAGICGAFNRNIKIGEVVIVVEDIISEMGAENGDQFLKYEKLNLGGTNTYRHVSILKNDLLNKAVKVKSITVNKVHGNDESINEVKKLYEPDIESMEGAAFFRGCEGSLKPRIQIRAVSNYVEKRDKSKWDIPLAVKNLNEFVINLVEELK